LNRTGTSQFQSKYVTQAKKNIASKTATAHFKNIAPLFIAL